MNEKMQGHAWEVDGHKVQCLTCGMVQTQETAGTKCGVYPLEPTPPASHDAGEAALADAMMYGQGFVLRSADGTETHIPVDSVVEHDAIATLTAEVARLTGELAEASARLHEVATLCATVEQERDRLTAELEKEKAQSRHLAGAVSLKIDELIAAENQCAYYKAQYSRAEQVRKEACEANVKAQAAMLWLEADIERSRKECEGLREAALATAGMYGRDCRESMLRAFEQAAALSAGEQHE